MNNLEQLAETIRQGRENLDYSPAGLATIIELDASYISKIKNRRLSYPPSRRTIEVLAQALDLDEYRLMLLAGHIPLCIKPLVCQFLLIEGDRSRQIMADALEEDLMRKIL